MPRFWTVALSSCLALAPLASRAQPQKVTIGAVLPLSGSEAGPGSMIRDGYELAVGLKMRDGGLNIGGHRVPVELLVRDDHSRPADGAQEVEALLGSGVDLMLGSFGIAQIAPESAVALRARVPYVVVEGSPTPEMRQSPFFFSVLAPLEQLALTTMRWIDDERRAGQLPSEARLAILWEDSDHGREYRRAVEEVAGTPAAPRAGYRVVLDRSFPINAKGHAQLIESVRAANADVLLVDAHYGDFLTLHHEYAAAGLCHKVLSYGVRGSERQAFKEFPAHALDYLVSTVWWNKRMRGPSEQFVREFVARFHRDPEWQDALGYEAARALLTAVEKAGSKDRERVRQALADLRLVESILPGGFLSFPKEYGQQARYLHIVMQNQADGTTPIVFPRIAAQASAAVPNPHCGSAAAGGGR